MKKLIILAIGLAMACNSSQTTVSDGDKNAVAKPTSTPETFAETITESELKEHLYTYASDEYEGRETGKPGQKMAVEYLKAQYEKMGIPAAQENGNYFQTVPLQVSQLPSGSLTLQIPVKIGSGSASG